MNPAAAKRVQPYLYACLSPPKCLAPLHLHINHINLHHKVQSIAESVLLHIWGVGKGVRI